MSDLAAALALGAAFGAVMQASGFCTMGALSDAFLFGSTYRLRILALALAIALVGTSAAAVQGLTLIDGRILYLGSRIGPFAAILGGVAFGFGMVLAGGCPSRNLVRAAEGDGRAAVVLAIVLLGTLAWVLLVPPDRSGEGLAALGRVRLLVAPPTGAAGLALTLLAMLAAAWWALRDGRLARDKAALLTGIGLGVLIVAGWLVTAPPATSLDGARAGLNLVSPALELAGQGFRPDPGVAPGPGILAGALAGAALTAALRGRLRRAWFRDRADLARNLVGAVLMGAGGGAALGCTIGHGLSGLAVLAPASILVVLGIIAGARWALLFLETGSLLPLRRRRA